MFLGRFGSVTEIQSLCCTCLVLNPTNCVIMTRIKIKQIKETTVEMIFQLSTFVQKVY